MCKPTSLPQILGVDPQRSLNPNDLPSPLMVDGMDTVHFTESVAHLLSDKLIKTDSNNNLKIGVLGKKTSSEYAAEHFKTMCPNNTGVEIIGLDSFDVILSSVIKGETDMSIIPHGSKKINEFYMHFDLMPVMEFYYATPRYGIACSKFFQGKEIKTIAYLPETEPILTMLIPDFANAGGELFHATSTENAAEMVVSGKVDGGLTNENAMKHHDLKWVAVGQKIPMSWTCFVRR
jgi:prephenate decarboxylase